MLREIVRALLDSPTREMISYCADCIAVAGFLWELIKYLQKNYCKEHDFDLFDKEMPHVVI